MRTNPTNSSNSTIKVAGQVFALATGLSFFNPCTATEFPIRQKIAHRSKQIDHPEIFLSGNIFRIGNQMVPETDGLGLNDLDFDFDIDVKCSPVEEFLVRANIISTANNASNVFFDEIYPED